MAEHSTPSGIATGRQKGIFRRIWEQRYLQSMVVPGIVWMIIFCYIPIYGLVIAFQDYNITQAIGHGEWVGLKHFISFFTDEAFGTVMRNTIGISLLKLCVSFPLSIVFAIMVSELRSSRYKRFVQTVSYLPHFLSWVVLGGILIMWLSETGIINDVLVGLGILKAPITFLAYPKYFWGISVLSDVWKEMGWSAIIYLAAIAGIDQEMYEAAKIDGAGRIRTIWSITLPSILSTVSIMFILTVSGLMNSNFDQIFVLRNVLNRPASDVIDIYVYRVGISQGSYSYSTAIGLFKSIIALILLVTANKVVDKLSGDSLF